MKILVFEQQGSGQAKIEGIRRYGPDHLELCVIGINELLPDFIDEPEQFLPLTPDHGGADLVISYLRHPDLVDHLGRWCAKMEIPLIASGQKIDSAHTPFTCCGLGRHPSLGEYGRLFGFPEYRVTVADGVITSLEVVRGAPCGATWEVIDQTVGMTVDQALSELPRLAQVHCSSDPSRFDPVTGKSPVHHAGHVHRAALQHGLRQARDRD